MKRKTPCVVQTVKTTDHKIISQCDSSDLAVQATTPAEPRQKPRILVLVGTPGSGKSTLAAQLTGYTTVNQDSLGNRKKCEKKMKYLLQQGRRVVVDRCNFDAKQRATWVKIAISYGISCKDIMCVHLDVPVTECLRRVLARPNHPTLKASNPKTKSIVLRFQDWLKPPSSVDNEGFGAGIVKIPHHDTRALQQLVAFLNTQDTLNTQNGTHVHSTSVPDLAYPSVHSIAHKDIERKGLHKRSRHRHSKQLQKLSNNYLNDEIVVCLPDTSTQQLNHYV